MGVLASQMYALVVTHDERTVYLDQVRNVAHYHQPLNRQPLPNAKEVAAIVKDLLEEVMDAVGDPPIVEAQIGEIVHEHRCGPPVFDDEDNYTCPACRAYDESLPPEQRKLEKWARNLGRGEEKNHA